MLLTRTWRTVAVARRHAGCSSSQNETPPSCCLGCAVVRKDLYSHCTQLHRPLLRFRDRYLQHHSAKVPGQACGCPQSKISATTTRTRTSTLNLTISAATCPACSRPSLKQQALDSPGWIDFVCSGSGLSAEHAWPRSDRVTHGQRPLAAGVQINGGVRWSSGRRVLPRRWNNLGGGWKKHGRASARPTNQRSAAEESSARNKRRGAERRGEGKVELIRLTDCRAGRLAGWLLSYLSTTPSSAAVLHTATT
jgi:hypothetical protein